MYEYIRDMANKLILGIGELDSWKAQRLATRANERFLVKYQTTLKFIQRWLNNSKNGSLCIFIVFMTKAGTSTKALNALIIKVNEKFFQYKQERTFA